MKITTSALIPLILLACVHTHSMDRPRSGVHLTPLPPSYQRGSQDPLIAALNQQRAHSTELQALLTQPRQSIIEKQQVISKQYELIGREDATAKIGLSITLVSALNYFANALLLTQPSISDTLKPLAGMGVNILATISAAAVLSTASTRQAHYSEQLEQLVEALKQLEGSEQSAFTDSNIQQKRAQLYTAHQTIGSCDAATIGLLIGVTLCALNAGNDIFILLNTDSTISLIAECINGGMITIGSGLLIRSLVLHAKNKRLASSLEAELKQLIMNGNEQEEV